MTLPEVIQLGILTIQPMEGEPEEDTTHRRQHGHRTVVPHQSRIPRQRYSITAILTNQPLPQQMSHSRIRASAIAEEIEAINTNTAITIDFMFLGALVNAYSRPVMIAKISEMAMRM
jgi:hypothetical protein